MLLDRSACLEFLRCPRTGATLRPDGDGGLECEGTNGDPVHRYSMLGGVPVLVAFESSVLDEDGVRARAGQSPLARPRKGRLGRLAKRIASPSNPASVGHYTTLATLLKQLAERPRLLVVGGATIGGGMETIYDDPAIEVCGFDIYASPVVQFVADAHRIPVADNSFDGVVIQAVLEHVLQPEVVVGEIHRVLRRDGLVYAETPFLQPVHEGAFDFTRFTESGHRYLFRHFERVGSGPLNASGTQVLLSLDYLVRGLFRSRTAGKAAKLAFFWLRYLDRLIPVAFAADAASGVWFMGRRSDHELTPAEIIAHYRGAD
jgi:SAM-dependent methyltransferase